MRSEDYERRQGSREWHREYGWNDDYEVVSSRWNDVTQRVDFYRAAVWYLWHYSVDAIMANIQFGCGEDWIIIKSGYVTAKELAFAEYDRIRELGGLYKEMRIQLQEAEFSNNSYELKDCR